MDGLSLPPEILKLDMSLMRRGFMPIESPRISVFQRITGFFLSKAFIFTQKNGPGLCGQIFIRCRICEILFWGFILRYLWMAGRRSDPPRFQRFGASSTKAWVILSGVNLAKLFFESWACCFFQDSISSAWLLKKPLNTA